MRPTPGPKMWTALPCRTRIRSGKRIVGFILLCFDKQQIITFVTKTREYYEEWTRKYLKFSERSWGPLWHLFLNSRIQTLQPEDTVCIGYSSDHCLPSAHPELGTGDTTASMKYTCAKRWVGGGHSTCLMSVHQGTDTGSNLCIFKAVMGAQRKKSSLRLGGPQNARRGSEIKADIWKTGRSLASQRKKSSSSSKGSSTCNVPQTRKSTVFYRNRKMYIKQIIY